MRAIVCQEPGRLEIMERSRPAAVPGGWARIAVSHVGICGTDYHIFQGRHPFLEYPRIMGHELSATVLEAPGESGLTFGRPVIVNPYISCGTCVACRKGKPNCCVAISVLGVHTDGAFCEEILVPAKNLYPADGLSLEAAATVEFLAIGAHAVRRAQAQQGSRSLVIGAGPIGLGTALFSRIAGHDVTLLDSSAERLAMASERLGLSSGVLAASEASAVLARKSQGEGFDVVFDATGHAGSMEAAFTHVAHGGTLVFVSVVKDDIRFSDPEFHKREMNLVGSRNATEEDFRHVISSIENGVVEVERLITHRTTLDTVPGDLARWATNKDGLIKAVVQVAA